MENTEKTTAALGIDPDGKLDEATALWASLLMLVAFGREPSRERELAERLAYLSGKTDALEKALFGP